jgi:hypothetical protein
MASSIEANGLFSLIGFGRLGSGCEKPEEFV